ncbi:UDP-N-acetylmuramoyl-tripeptide--D-alanyl-D-alanine ligase [Aureispira anguillae]|nr:UDP-N-acetylmuramoyl-tripeptide--D-alanyl-D-alanine ligase [Aureispira anguillae]
MKALYQLYLDHPFVFIDTRKELLNGIFVAVGQKDERGAHRGNQFATFAIESGKAAYALINDVDLKEKYKEDDRYIFVEDGEKTLQDLAKYHRQQLTCPIIAIAGSNGKTTLKELLSRVLSSQYKTFATRGNLNNHLGVPLSLLSIDSSYEMAILEIGANHLEETRFLAEIIEPDYGLVTNCGKDHLGEYGSIENIIKANKELYDVLAEMDRTAFVCTNDSLLVDISAAITKRIFYGKTATVKAQILARPFLKFCLQIDDFETTVQTNLFGQFWLDALLGAAAVGHHFGIAGTTIKNALESYQPAALRSQLIEWNGNKVLLDCYNANPSSMEVFLAEIQASSLQASQILILGEMLELGAYSVAEHQQLIDRINWEAFKAVFLVGAAFLEVSFPPAKQLHYFENKAAVEDYLSKQDYQQCYFFVKGSRGNRLEELFVD